jgi:hypothetical protein
LNGKKTKRKKGPTSTQLGREKNKTKSIGTKKEQPSVHPWRICPYGEHWVRTHPLRIRPSQTFPEGHETTRHEHCARNPSGKDQLYPDEIREISSKHFSDLKNKPCPLPFEFGTQGSKYDDLIAGWVQYWNDILKPDTPLDPNLIKALVASESSFDPDKLANPKNSNSARGLTQILNATRKLLGGDHGGLKDHLITVTKADLNDPSVNICSGVRWLFEKRRLASARLKRTASWIDAIWEYKGTKLVSQKEAEKIKNIFNKFYEGYQQCK